MEEERLIVGVDPGYSGAIVALKLDGRIAFALVGGGGDKKYKRVDYNDPESLFDAFSQAFKRPTPGDIPYRVVTEKVWSSPGFGTKGNWNFGGFMHCLRALLYLYMLPYEEVAPVTWQTAMGVRAKPVRHRTDTKKKKPDAKEKARLKRMRSQELKKNAQAVAAKLWPRDERLAHDGFVDAALIAEYVRRREAALTIVK